MGTDRITCGKCHRKCTGQVLSVGDIYFHHYCFTCQKCGNELGEDAFYNKDGSYYCAKDYLDNFGERCFKCNEFLEGEVITALGNTFHLDCFTCGHCKKFFPPGETVIFDGQDYVCENCDYSVDSSSRQPLHKCAGCRKDIEHGQALMALDQHWHPNCFTCQKCGIVLHGEYMGKDGFAFCEKDYQAEFGVTCAGCEGYITGKVLQAGDKHYHPQCSRCAKCGQMFGEGEEMYLQGSEIWHPECSEMVREMERAEKERAQMEQREAEDREMEEEERRREMEEEARRREMEEEARRREMEEEARRREMEQREVERQEAERRENERRDAERRETERREAERREVERREAEMREVERRDAERRDAERRDAERREADRREAERQDAERLEAERREAEQRERERREREIEAERREAERREKEQLEIERRDRERREMEYRESQRLDADRRDAERKREYYQPGKQVDVDIGRRASPDFDDLPPPPRPEELPPGPPAPPTRTDSRAKDWKARYGSLPRTGSGSLNGDAQEVQMRNGPSRPRPFSYHESSHSSYDETTQPTPVSPGGKYKTSVQLKIGRSSDDSMIGRVATSSSSSAKSPAEIPIFTYRQLKVDNYRLPRGVDKKNLETYLSDEEFREVFKMARDDFYQLPKWKQHDQKKKVKLF